MSTSIQRMLILIAGRQTVGDELYDEILHPTAVRLIERCDAILHFPGASKGADNDVRLAHERGIPVHYNTDEIPTCATE